MPEEARAVLELVQDAVSGDSQVESRVMDLAERAARMAQLEVLKLTRAQVQEDLVHAETVLTGGAPQSSEEAPAACTWLDSASEQVPTETPKAPPPGFQAQAATETPKAPPPGFQASQGEDLPPGLSRPAQPAPAVLLWARELL